MRSTYLQFEHEPCTSVLPMFDSARASNLCKLFIAFVLTICLLAVSHSARAQFGLGGLLNPEGFRLLPQVLVAPRHPGKPDPRWKSFRWKFFDADRSLAFVGLDRRGWANVYVIDDYFLERKGRMRALTRGY